MGILGNVGSLYTVVLIILLVLGLGLLGLWLVDFIVDTFNKNVKSNVNIKGNNVKAK